VNAPAYSLRARDRVLELGERPLLMGIVNASPESFSDDGASAGATLERRLALAIGLVRDGADILDVGGESARTDMDAISPRQEIERVVPLIERIVAELGSGAGAGVNASAGVSTGASVNVSAGANASAGVGTDTDENAGVVVSVDTYKPEVAAAAIAAGASIVNDVSALRDPELARVCAQTGAALVVMHTRAAPKQRLQDENLYGEDVCGEVLELLRERIDLALAAGVSREQLILDPGPDFSKTPAQTIALLRDLERLHALGRPLLLAVSRKDFVGALTATAPRERLPGTLAALAYGLDHGAHIYRVHDVAAAAQFIAVRQALSGERPPRRDLALASEHRYEPRPRLQVQPAAR
jgi:dihydropteroate synthase